MSYWQRRILAECIPVAPLKFANHLDCALLILRIVSYFSDNGINLLLAQNPGGDGLSIPRLLPVWPSPREGW